MIQKIISECIIYDDIQAEQKKTAYQAMLKMKAKSKYPVHIDEKNLKEEAILKRV